MSKHEIKQLLSNNQCLINSYEQQDEKITKDTNLVIGAGIFGLNIALNLIEKGEKVLLVTESFESISYHYPIGGSY